MKRRRDFIGLMVGLATLGGTAAAQQHGGASPARILFVNLTDSSIRIGLSRRLKDLGYVEQRDVVIEVENGILDEDRLRRELSRWGKVDVIVAVGPAAVLAAQRAAQTIPIVAVDFETDPVVAGLVREIARPGGNVTGLFLDQPSLVTKWLQLVAEIAPSLGYVVVVRDPSTGGALLGAIERAAA